MARGRHRSDKIRKHIIDILEKEEYPLSSRELSFKVESRCGLRASSSTIHQVIRPLVAKGVIRKENRTGFHSATYSLK